MTEAERDFYLRVMQMQFSTMTKREKNRMWRKHRLLHIAISHLSREADRPNRSEEQSND